MKEKVLQKKYVKPLLGGIRFKGRKYESEALFRVKSIVVLRIYKSKLTVRSLGGKLISKFPLGSSWGQ